MQQSHMRVGINLLPLIPSVVGGIQQHIESLLDRLLAVQELSFTLFVNGRIAKLFDDSSDRVRVVVTSRKSQEIRSRYLHGEFDVLFAPMMDPGVDQAICPMVVLLVDLQHRHFPAYFSSEELSSRALHWEWPARAAQTLCVSSRYVAQDAVEKLGISPDRIVFTPPGLPAAFRSGFAAREIGETPRLPDLPAKFLFYPSNTWEHKNHRRLVEALAVARRTVPEMHVVFTGSDCKGRKEIDQAARKYGVEDAIVWLGYVAQDLMPWLYRKAEGLVFPSIFEGFGIPLIEAMACGCPIACSDRTSLPEVAGNAAVLFDPYSIEEIAIAMCQLWDDADLRSALVDQGRQRLSELQRAESIEPLLAALRASTGKFGNPICWNPQHVLVPDDVPLVSVVVPSYQQGRFISACIDSILRQNYPRIEVIVMDGGSTDGTCETLAGYGDRIHWVSEPDDGQAAAVNKALALSSGSIIGWLNSDDVYRPGAIRNAVSALKGGSGCRVVYGEADYIDRAGVRIGRYPTDTFSVSNLLNHCCICQPSVFFQRSLIDEAGMLDTRFDMAMDYELWLRFSRFTPFLFLPETLAASRIHADTKTANFRRESIRESIFACKLHYARTSMLWCKQFAHEVSGRSTIWKKSRVLYSAIQAVAFAYAVLRHNGISEFKRVARTVRNIIG